MGEYVRRKEGISIFIVRVVHHFIAETNIFCQFHILFSVKSFDARKSLPLRGLLCFLVVKIERPKRYFWRWSKLTSAFPQWQVYHFQHILYVCEICLCRRLSECPALCCTHAILHQTRFNPLKRNSWACVAILQCNIVSLKDLIKLLSLGKGSIEKKRFLSGIARIMGGGSTHARIFWPSF